MTIKEIEKVLKSTLGGTYGGPSLSYEDGKFILYNWYDAPVGMDTIAEGSTLDELINNLLEKVLK